MDGWINIGTKIDTKSFDAQIDYIEKRMATIEKTLEGGGISTEDVTKLRAEYEKLANKLVDIRKKQSAWLNEAKDGLSQTIRKVAKWGLALFGIRSIFNLLKNSASTISQYNEDMANKIDTMKNALAFSIAPIVEKIVNLFYTLMQYAQYIVKAWTGHDIFAGASKNLKGASKSAKELKKQLAGFDEMNVLSDSSSSSAGVGGAGITPLPQGEIPDWVKWIADNGDIVVGIISGITAGLISMNVLGIAPIVASGIGLLVAGLVIAVSNLITFLKNPTFENFTNIIIGIGIAVTGLGIIIGSLPLAVFGAIAAIVGVVLKNYEFIKGLLDGLVRFFEEDFVHALEFLLGPLGDIIAAPFIFAVNFVRGLFNDLFGGLKEVVNGIVLLFKGDFKEGIKKVFSGLKSILLAPINALIDGVNALIKGINKISFDVPSWIPVIGGKKWGFNIPKIPRLAKGGIINNPGKGVFTGSAIAGEAGREFYMPLQDSQMLAMVGEAIGKYVTINANITNTMNGRVISRELQRIQNNTDFAFNR